ncbi:hypothetical protein P4133_28680 [Pseudomonas aeruginosa]|nr:hypothetical protein [Pseudomonas aeruginosa]
MVAHAHDRAFAELAFDLSQGRGQGALLFSSIEVLAKSGRPDGHEQLYK